VEITWNSVVRYRDSDCMSWLLMCTGVLRFIALYFVCQCVKFMELVQNTLIESSPRSPRVTPGRKNGFDVKNS